jgi:transposase
VKLDGKYLLSTTDPSLSAEDIALGYRQLLEVERAFRTMKSTLDLRPLRHRLPERIKAHVLLCWLGLLLARAAENESGQTWEQVRDTLEENSLDILCGKDRRVQMVTDLTDEQRKTLKKMSVTEPKRVQQMAETG